jgi:hypothetical protein
MMRRFMPLSVVLAAAVALLVFRAASGIAAHTDR